MWKASLPVLKVVGTKILLWICEKIVEELKGRSDNNIDDNVLGAVKEAKTVHSSVKSK